MHCLVEHYDIEMAFGFPVPHRMCKEDRGSPNFGVSHVHVVVNYMIYT